MEMTNVSKIFMLINLLAGVDKSFLGKFFMEKGITHQLLP